MKKYGWKWNKENQKKVNLEALCKFAFMEAVKKENSLWSKIKKLIKNLF